MAQFKGIAPSDSDILGDRWARQISLLYDRTVARFAPDLPQEKRAIIWNLWQYMYCNAVGMRGRVIASPQAMIACGWNVTAADVDKAESLLFASGDCLD